MEYGCWVGSRKSRVGLDGESVVVATAALEEENDDSWHGAWHFGNIGAVTGGQAHRTTPDIDSQARIQRAQSHQKRAAGSSIGSVAATDRRHGRLRSMK